MCAQRELAGGAALESTHVSSTASRLHIESNERAIPPFKTHYRSNSQSPDPVHATTTANIACSGDDT